MMHTVTLFLLQEPVIKIKLSNMKQLFKRRYLLKHVVSTVVCYYDCNGCYGAIYFGKQINARVYTMCCLMCHRQILAY